MRNTTPLLAAAALFGLTGAALAQTTTFDNQDAASDAVQDLRDQIDEDAERDTRPFGNAGRPLGFDGSVALRGTMSTGNTDSADLGIGANLGFYDGTNGYEAIFSYSYGEQDGAENENRLLYSLEYTRDFGTRWYGYATVQGSSDDYASYTQDTFAGIGIGYKLIERPDVTWYVSGGPGYRWMEMADGTQVEEEAVSLSSNYTARLSDTVLGTLDTDVIYSDTDMVVYNDIGLNVSMTDALALRTSLSSEYHSDPLPGADDLDNTFGVSLVHSFN